MMHSHIRIDFHPGIGSGLEVKEEGLWLESCQLPYPGFLPPPANWNHHLLEKGGVTKQTILCPHQLNSYGCGALEQGSPEGGGISVVCVCTRQPSLAVSAVLKKENVVKWLHVGPNLMDGELSSYLQLILLRHFLLMYCT